jgi:hypothetical protein
MTKIEYLHDEGDGNYCICPDAIVTIPASNIQNKVDLRPFQIRHKYANKQTTGVSEQVGATN